ncbi:hypothetical protein VNO77_16130 [Canavalia gladiata]|uniref:Uncharacterized protein n=1 Tax=Canavalia gladiata TaxID=3824 RepID=A0AAN9M0G0_CANGL
MFNIICELPEIVARTLIPRMRVVKGTSKAINYLTLSKILISLVTTSLWRESKACSVMIRSISCTILSAYWKARYNMIETKERILKILKCSVWDDV